MKSSVFPGEGGGITISRIFISIFSGERKESKEGPGVARPVQTQSLVSKVEVARAKGKGNQVLGLALVWSLFFILKQSTRFAHFPNTKYTKKRRGASFRFHITCCTDFPC